MAKRKTPREGHGRGRWHPGEEPPDLVFAVCQRFFNETSASRKGAATKIARWLEEKHDRGDLTREKVYALVQEGMRRGYLALLPPCDQFLAQRIADIFEIDEYDDNHDMIQVVQVSRPESHSAVSAKGAETVLALIKRLKKQFHRDRVHIGLGSGASSMKVARRLAELVRSDTECPDLTLHALSTAGFDVENALDSPLTYFGFFENVLPKMQYVGLFAPPVVACEEYEDLKRRPGVKQSFDLVKEVDIVISSFASAADKHGLLKRFLEYMEVLGDLAQLRDEGWVGEVQFRPFNPRGPIITKTGNRAVTLFELSGLVELAKSGQKFMVLLAAPCSRCQNVKTDALRYLLHVPSLRIWTHLVTDVETAVDLVQQG